MAIILNCCNSNQMCSHKTINGLKAQDNFKNQPNRSKTFPYTNQNPQWWPSNVSLCNEDINFFMEIFSAFQKNQLSNVSRKAASVDLKTYAEKNIHPTKLNIIL